MLPPLRYSHMIQLDFISNENTLPIERKTLELQAYGEVGFTF